MSTGSTGSTGKVSSGVFGIVTKVVDGIGRISVGAILGLDGAPERVAKTEANFLDGGTIIGTVVGQRGRSNSRRCRQSCLIQFRIHQRLADCTWKRRPCLEHVLGHGRLSERWDHVGQVHGMRLWGAVSRCIQASVASFFVPGG